ncbi:MAG: DMT family transporter [Actinomycetota bacterium]|nr:DMT family transporter [Actinomycetota bacterium]
MRLSALGRHPTLVALAGAMAIAFSGILYRLADVSPETGAFFRCLYALPPLFLLARWEDRRLGPRPRRARLLAYAAGILFAVDLVFWHHAIEAVGAGLATVLGNTQVVLVGLLAWALLGERPSGRALAAIPVVLVGVVLISGVVGEGAYGSNPPLGVLFGVVTAVAYSGFLLVLRAGNADRRRPAGPLFDATLASAFGVAVFAVPVGELDLTPGVESQAWLVALALSSQVLGWLLISISLPRLPAVVTSILLTLQPVASVVFAALLIDESPSPLQIAGAAAILSGLVLASARAPRRPRSADEPAPAPSG